MTKRRLKLKWKIILIILISILIIYILLRYIGTSGLITKEYKIVNSNLPDSFNGIKIIQFSDLHYGMSVDEKKLANIVNEININKPDIVFFTGDLVDKNTKYTEEIENILVKYLSNIKCYYGCYYVNGNHDDYNSSYNSLMEKANFKSLNNKNEIITSKSNENIFITGLSTNSTKNNYNEVFKENDYKYKILITHYPDNFDKISMYNFDLVLAGHSHNGQVRLPYIGSIIKADNAKKYYEPYYKINNTDFYISGGIGNSILNVRMFNAPSINMYRIINKNSN